MKRLMPFLAVIATYSLATASLARAQDTRSRVQGLVEAPEVPAIPEGVDRIESVTQGQPAPFSGMLLDTDTSIRWVNALRWWPMTFENHGQLFLAIFDEAEASYERRLSLIEDSYGREITGLRENVRDISQQLADSLTREFHETVEFGVLLGVIISMVIVGVGGGLALGLTN